MIEPTDASKCDGRQVKNKLNPLTKKKEGETRTMCIQGMKTWKLGLFFVVSLMLVVGLIAENATAHNVGSGTTANETAIGNVTVSPSPHGVTAEDIIDLKITYNATTVLADTELTFDHDNNSATDGIASEGRIRVTLPSNWGPSAVSDILTAIPDPVGDDTYLTVTKSGTVTFASTPLDVGGNLGDGYYIDIDLDVLKSGSVILTVHNLEVAEWGDITDGKAAISVLSDRSQTRGTPEHPQRNASGDTITVGRKKLGNVVVTKGAATPEDTVDLTVKYAATMAMANEEDTTADPQVTATHGRILVGLPAGWGPEEADNLELMVTASSGVTGDFDDEGEFMGEVGGDKATGYKIPLNVTVMKSGDYVMLAAKGVEFVDGGLGTIDVLSGTMDAAFTDTNFDNTAADESLDAGLYVPMSATPMIAMQTDETEADYEARMAHAAFMIDRLKLGNVRVSVTNGSVTPEDTVDLRVMYTATSNLAMPDPAATDADDDTTYGMIQFRLPDGWGPADPAELDLTVAPSTSSVKFGEGTLEPEGMKVSPDKVYESGGYVIPIAVDNLRSGQQVTLVVKGFEFVNGELGVIEVLSDRYMAADDTRGSELYVMDSHLPMSATPMIAMQTDETEADYEARMAHAAIKIDRVKLGNVMVSTSALSAEDTVTLKVKYTATVDMAVPDPAATEADDMGSTYGRIQVTLPEDWRVWEITPTISSKTNGVMAEVSPAGSVIHIDVDSLRKGQYVELTVENLGFVEGIGTVGVLSNRYMEETERDVDTLDENNGHMPKSIDRTMLEVQRLKLGTVNVTPVNILVDDTVSLKVRYTATSYLADSTATPPTYGRIQVTLPTSWAVGTPTATVTSKSRGVVASVVDDGTESVIHIDVDKLKTTQYIEITVTGVGFNDNVVGIVEVLSDRYTEETERDGDTALDEISSHMPKTAMPQIAVDEEGSADHAAIMVSRLDLGRVVLDKTTVTADTMVDLEVKYIATSHLAVPDPKATETNPMNSTFGRIRVALPPAWVGDGTISDGQVVGDSKALYVTASGSGGVVYAKDANDDENRLDVDGNTVYINVDSMRKNQFVTLTVHNLTISSLDGQRSRQTDITKDMKEDKYQIEVYSNMFPFEGHRNTATWPALYRRLVSFNAKIAVEMGGSDDHPTITVTRKALGEFKVEPNEVTAGSMKDFTLTYKATEAMKAGDAIEIRLPKGWPAPEVLPLNGRDNDGTDLTKDKEDPHIYLSGSTSRFENAGVSVIDSGGGVETPGTVNRNGSIVRVELGKDITRNSSIILKYSKVTVQRHKTSDDNPALIETFSGLSVSVNDVPQFPVSEQADDKIKVTLAANGSGKVTFEFGGIGEVKPLATGINVNTNASIPAGTAASEHHSLRVVYTPDGDMDAGEFEIRLPSGWNAVEVLTSLDDDPTIKKSGDKITTVTAALPAVFGERLGEILVLTFTDITVPKTHGNQAFVARSKHNGGSLAQLSPRPMAFVGNTMADNDAVAVKITPPAAYQNQDNVDFVITLTANGPMYDSKIEIQVPEGLTGLQTGTAGDPNYVKTTATVGGVMVKTFDVVGERILIETAELNAGGKITVHLNNVNLKDVSANQAVGFRVGTKTRGSQADLSDVTDYAPIENSDSTRSIEGGLVRTVVGSGTMAVKPNLFEQGARSKNITLTFTAATDLPDGGLDLVITAPFFIETELVENTHVPQAAASKFHKDVEAADRLVVGGNTITWSKIVLREGEKFVTQINRVNLREETGVDRWGVTLGGTALDNDDNDEMTVVGTLEEDVVFEIVDDAGIAVSSPNYHAASVQSIRFRFTTVNTDILPGGRLWFSVPVGWTLPRLTDTTNRATVSIVRVNDAPVKDKDDKEVLNATMVPYDGSNKGTELELEASGRQVSIIVGSKGRLNEGDSVTVRYGDAPDPMKYPVHISRSVVGTSGNDADGLAVHGWYRASGEAGFRPRSTGTIRIDVTNVEDGTGTVTVTSPSVRASSTDNLIRITYTAIGTMDGGAVRLIIPDTWGAAQRDDNTAANHIHVAAAGNGAVLTDFEVLNSGRSVEANLTTFGEGSKVMFTYGGGVGANKGAVAQAEIGEATFIVQSKGISGGDFVDITDADSLEALIIDVGGAASGSGTVAVSIVKNKSGEVVYDSATGAERRIFAGDDMTYLEFTYTAEQSITEGELELIVPSEWTAPQRDDTSQPGFTYFDDSSGLVSDEEYNGQSVTATIAMGRGDVIKINYGWYDTENGGAHAPQTPGTYEFQVEFDGVGVAMQPSVTVHGGTASKLVVTAPSSVSADPNAVPGLITVAIQDDTDAAAVVDSDLEITLISSNNNTGTFADADGEAIVDNKVTILAGNTEAPAYYSDTGAGTTATIIATAVGLSSGMASITVTSDIDRVDANSVSVSHATAKAGDTVTVTASGTAGRTATFSVGAIVTTMGMTESPANSGSYSGSFPVADDLHDGTYNVMVSIGDMSATVENAIIIDTTAPIITASATPATVGDGDVVTITAMATGATSVTADVSALDSTQTSVVLTMANGSYSVPVTISDANEALNGSKTITVTAMDAAGNSARSTAMVTLDNKMSFTSMIPALTTVLFHVPLNDADISTVGDLKTKIGDAVNLVIVWNHAESRWDSNSDDVMVTADLGVVLVMSDEASVTFEGDAWGGGASAINLQVGTNVIGLPVNDSRVVNVSDIAGLFPAGVVGSVLDAGLTAVDGKADPDDGPVAGDAGYLVTASTTATVALIGSGWSNGADAAAAPIALAGYNVDNQTPVLDVRGSVVDEITGLAREGFRVKVKNLSTKAALSNITSVEAAGGYNITFVDLKTTNAARVGDVLEISADSPSPLIGVKPVRHIVTVDDVKNSRIQLEDLIAYEIPAETELLRNYPNPFNPETWIPYHLAEDANVSLTIYDVNGEVVRDIDVGHQIAAKYDTRSKAIYWDGRNRFGEQVASGIYFYSLSAGDFSATRKMVILK